MFSQQALVKGHLGGCSTTLGTLTKGKTLQELWAMAAALPHAPLCDCLQLITLASFEPDSPDLTGDVMVETKTWVMDLEAGGRSQKTRHAGGLWKLQNSKKGYSPLKPTEEAAL